MTTTFGAELSTLPDEALSVLLSGTADEVERLARIVRLAQDTLSTTERRWTSLHAEQQRRIREGRYGPYVVGADGLAQAERMPES